MPPKALTISLNTCSKHQLRSRGRHKSNGPGKKTHTNFQGYNKTQGEYYKKNCASFTRPPGKGAIYLPPETLLEHPRSPKASRTLRSAGWVTTGGSCRMKVDTRHGRGAPFAFFGGSSLPCGALYPVIPHLSTDLENTRSSPRWAMPYGLLAYQRTREICCKKKRTKFRRLY